MFHILFKICSLKRAIRRFTEPYKDLHLLDMSLPCWYFA